MDMQTQSSSATPRLRSGLIKHPLELILALIAGLILLGFAIYAIMLLQHVSARLDDLPKMTALLSTTNDRLTAVSLHLERMEASLAKLPPLISKVNTGVRQIAPPLRAMNQNAQATSPTFRRMDDSLTTTNQKLAATNQKLTSTNEKLSGVQQKFGELQNSMQRVEESTHRLRKILPR
jgi:chromosome segregation ATPase